MLTWELATARPTRCPAYAAKSVANSASPNTLRSPPSGMSAAVMNATKPGTCSGTGSKVENLDINAEAAHDHADVDIQEHVDVRTEVQASRQPHV